MSVLIWASPVQNWSSPDQNWDLGWPKSEWGFGLNQFRIWPDSDLALTYTFCDTGVSSYMSTREILLVNSVKLYMPTTTEKAKYETRLT